MAQTPDHPPQERPARQLPLQDQKALFHFVMNGLPDGKTRVRSLLEFVIPESIAHPRRFIGPKEVIRAQTEGRFDFGDELATESAIKSAGQRAGNWLSNFFEKGGGRSKPFKIRMDDRGYQVFFEPNDSQPEQDDLVFRFWEPHLTTLHDALLIYPEPQFFRDSKHTYFRNWRVRSKHDVGFFDLNDRPLIPSYSFVPAGVVAAMVLLYTYFHERHFPLPAKPIRPGAHLHHDTHAPLIVLGSPGTLPQITELESPLALRTNPSGYRHKGRDYEDGTQKDMEDAEVNFIKHALLTRRPYGPQARCVTILAGSHGRCAEGLAGFLLNSDRLKTLAEALRCGDKFPQSFQALIEVHMNKHEGEPSIGEMRLKTVVNYDSAKKNNRNRSAQTRQLSGSAASG